MTPNEIVACFSAEELKNPITRATVRRAVRKAQLRSFARSVFYFVAIASVIALAFYFSI